MQNYSQLTIYIFEAGASGGGSNHSYQLQQGTGVLMTTIVMMTLMILMMIMSKVSKLLEEGRLWCDDDDGDADDDVDDDDDADNDGCI